MRVALSKILSDDRNKPRLWHELLGAEIVAEIIRQAHLDAAALRQRHEFKNLDYNDAPGHKCCAICCEMRNHGNHQQ